MQGHPQPTDTNTPLHSISGSQSFLERMQIIETAFLISQFALGQTTHFDRFQSFTLPKGGEKYSVPETIGKFAFLKSALTLAHKKPIYDVFSSYITKLLAF